MRAGRQWLGSWTSALGVVAFVVLTGCGSDDRGGSAGGDDPGTVLQHCVQDAGLTMAQTPADLRKLDGIDRGIPPNAIGTVAIGATSIYNDDANPPWEVVLFRRGLNETAESMETLRPVSRFARFDAVGYAQPRDEAAVDRAVECTVDE